MLTRLLNDVGYLIDTTRNYNGIGISRIKFKRKNIICICLEMYALLNFKDCFVVGNAR